MTDRQRLARIKRLVIIRERVRDNAQSALADARREADSDRDAHDSAREQWEQECEQTEEHEAVASVRDFAEQRGHLNNLRRRADRAAVKRIRSAHDEELRREEAKEAHTELRKMEIWNDNENKRIETENNRLAQIDTDEIAAQRKRRQA
jgi:hypothetical protein